jgi:N-methylhydantoinase A/oxoprolinase/acetone carboxylase beta subunit
LWSGATSLCDVGCSSLKIYKFLSTPYDPSIATMRGLKKMAADHQLSLPEFLHKVSVIVHGTTVTTNAVLTYSGAKTALLTTKGFRDTLEMRRGVREEEHNNRFENAAPLIERYLKLPDAYLTVSNRHLPSMKQAPQTPIQRTRAGYSNLQMAAQCFQFR